MNTSCFLHVLGIDWLIQTTSFIRLTSIYHMMAIYYPIDSVSIYYIPLINIMDYDWVEFTNSKFRFKTDIFSDNTFGKRFNRLNHEYMLISVASYGGPIAITSDKTKILTLREDDPSVDNICIFSNEG